MTNALFPFLNTERLQTASYPDGIGKTLDSLAKKVWEGDFEAVLTDDFARLLLGKEENDATAKLSSGNIETWTAFISRRVDHLLQYDGCKSKVFPRYQALLTGVAALLAFIQSNITGPPLNFSSSDALLPSSLDLEHTSLQRWRRELVTFLSIDGEVAYPLTPNVELFCLAKIILNHSSVVNEISGARWARLRVNFLHQRMLSENSAALQTQIYQDLKDLEGEILPQHYNYNKEAKVGFLLESAAINTHHSFDVKAREDLNRAAKETGFEFALTGLLGKRTKFQQKDLSQLVVLARSTECNGTYHAAVHSDSELPPTLSEGKSQGNPISKPANLDLNDDTLLESISFSRAQTPSTTTVIQDESSLPSSLASLDPSDQSVLKPLDSIILLSLASSITNTSPSHGLTREETLPYATRVLEGGSTNWQVYTQALLVRSRIEGYKSRTVERGVLQLQALVDQVIAETTRESSGSQEADRQSTASTFLPRPKEAEAASISERLQYIFQLSSPTRWELEAELAARWVSLGGLRTALEIYERLQLWAEAALCWAAVEREDKAKKIVRRQLFYSAEGKDADVDAEEEQWEGEERDPPPPDAPRLYCILGDISYDPRMYDRAWHVSNGRYARAQRSLGRYYFSAKDYLKAAEAYAKSLKVNQLNHPTWFALGCVRLELQEWEGAVDAFARTVQLDESDAEAWSNLAAALLRMGTKLPAQEAWPPSQKPTADEDEDLCTPSYDQIDPERHKKDALKALKRAATLKHESYRIWENLLIISASLTPPSYTDVVISQTRIIEIRGPSIGEKAIDEDILDLLVRHIITSDLENDHPSGYDASRPGLARMVVELMDKKVVPLITSSRRLWQTVAKLALWRNRPSSALEANEKAWRAVIGQPGWEFGAEGQWEGVVDATVELVDAYESLGLMERTEGLGAGEGEVVAKDWRFKGRSAVRGIMGRGKGSWEGTRDWERLSEALEGLKGAG
ncbi:MAG: hypothetical protein M1827_001867 [Pycnora praestabilis]|nr:MAG: hypothetical protein M1827_001867 [Pycnora praestabilis]